VTCSAEPGALLAYCDVLRRGTARTADLVDRVESLYTAYISSCRDAPPPPLAPRQARLAVNDAEDLARAVKHVAEAFIEADRSRAGRSIGTVTTDDGALARRLVARYPGIVSGPLADAFSYDRGRRTGRTLASSEFQDGVELLEGLDRSDLTDRWFAAGLVNTLGSKGIGSLLSEVEQRYADVRVTATTAEQVIVVLRQLLVEASKTLPDRTRPDVTPTAPDMALDLDIVRNLGRSVAGRSALRELSVGIDGLSTSALVAVAAALLAGPSAAADGFPASRYQLLRSRVVAQSGGLVEISILEALARNPLACVALELQSPAGTSTTLKVLREHRSDHELDQVSKVLRATLVTAVGRGWLEAWREAPSARGAAIDRRPVHVLLAGLPAQIAELTHGPIALRRTLADVVAVHPGFFDHRLNDEGGPSSTPTQTRTDVERYLTFTGRDRTALTRLTAGLVDHYAGLARQVAASTDPLHVTDDTFERALTWARADLTALENAAFAAGQTHNLYADLAITFAEMGARQGVSKGLSGYGPAGTVAGKVAGRGISAGADKARETWADPNDRRDRDVRRVVDRSTVHVVALALAGESKWSASVVYRPPVESIEALAALDVGRSEADQSKFEAWLQVQIPAISRPLSELIVD